MAKTYKIMYLSLIQLLPSRFSDFPKKSCTFKSLMVGGGGGGAVAIFELQKGAKEVSFTACHSDKL